MISDILFSGVLSPSLNLDLIFLLSEYYEFYPHETNSVLISLYDYSNDPVIKTIARDILSQFSDNSLAEIEVSAEAVSYTHLRAHETPEHLVCRLLLEKKKYNQQCINLSLM